MKTPSLHNASRIVIKVGSLMIADAKSGDVRSAWLKTLADDIASLRKAGKEIIIVSSGAITLGRKTLGLHQESLMLAQKQAAASVGQIALANAWGSALEKHSINTSQVLLTAEDTEDRRRYLNAQQTLNTLLELNVIPVINENDTVTTAEIRYGDNDRLAACVAGMVGADVLVLLSDIDGLYTTDPSIDKNAKLIPIIESITADIEAMAGDARDHFSTGGMKTKITAAKCAGQSGCHMVIAKGSGNSPLKTIMDGGVCSWFIASETPISARKQWIASAANNRGSITVDDGAVAALGKGKSLLPSGITAAQGNFERGDTIQILSTDGTALGNGITLYSAEDISAIMGKQSDSIADTLGYHRGDAVIHRDDMVLEKSV